jgi:hypothetical protein
MNSIKNIHSINRGNTKAMQHIFSNHLLLSLGLLFIFMLSSFTSMGTTNDTIQNTDKVQPQLYTVANIVAPTKDNNFYTITFYQSARFYKLQLKNKNCTKALTVLKYSKKNNVEVLVFLTENFGDTIDNVKKNKK